MIDRREFTRLSAGSLALAALGCSGRPSTDRDSTLIVGFFSSEMLDLFSDQSSMYLVFLPLVARNVDGAVEGRLAERWEHSPDYRTWTVHLRRDVRWHDGVPVTAHDIKFTLDLLSSPEWLYAQPGGYSVTVLDDTTYTIEYHNLLADEVGKGSPLDRYTVYYPKHLLEHIDREDSASYERWFSQPVGNGPYRWVRSEPRIMMEFEANSDHYRGKPSIERVILKFADTVPELLSGNVDLVNFANMAMLQALSGDDRFQAYHSVYVGNSLVIAWNLRSDLFRDATVRRALTMAIDRAELHEVVRLPAGLTIYDVPHSGGLYRRGEVPDPLPYNPEQARQLLDEAGWLTNDGDGVRERDGKPFRFTLLTTGGSYPMRGGEDVYIHSQLSAVGIDVQLQTMNYPIVRDRMAAGEFDAALTFQSSSLDSPMGILPFFGEDSVIGYAISEVVALVNELKSTADPDEIDRIYRQFVPFFEADLPVTYLYPAGSTSVASRRVRGLSSPYRADPVRYVDELWLEERR